MDEEDLYDEQSEGWGFRPRLHGTNHNPDIAEQAYMKALKTNYRLGNWEAEDLEAYCGIYPG